MHKEVQTSTLSTCGQVYNLPCLRVNESVIIRVCLRVDEFSVQPCLRVDECSVQPCLLCERANIVCV